MSPGPSACGADVLPLHHVPLKGASAGTEIISKRVLAPVPQSWFHAARCLLEEQTCSSSARAAWALFWLRPHPKLVCGGASGSDCRPQCPFSLSTTYATMRRAAVWAVVVRSSACASGKGMATVTEGARPDTRQRGAGFSFWRVCVGSGERGGGPDICGNLPGLPLPCCAGVTFRDLASQARRFLSQTPLA